MKKCLIAVWVLFLIAMYGNAQSPVLYGMTQNGGDSSAGTIFRYSVATGTDTVLHSFGGVNDGTYPSGSLLLATNGLLYGLTPTGGTYNKGVLFSYNIGAGIYTVVHSFGTGTDAQTPRGSLIEADNGLLYGMSESGGVNSAGTIFTYNRYTDSTQVIYNFGTLYDGELPFGSFYNFNDSLIYGLTLRGGGAGGSGILFDFNTIENSDTILYSFGANDTDGQNPYGSVILANGNSFYGTTYYGGEYNNGSIFAYYYSDTTQRDTLLYSFHNGADGQNPHGSFVATGTNTLYGTTVNGGASDSGAIISYNYATRTEAVVHNFTGGADGSNPYGTLLLASNQLLYGTTLNGGANSKGSVFSFNTVGNVETTVYSFGSGTDGASPMGDLIAVAGTPAITGIPQAAATSEKLSVFPNPTSAQFTVSLPGTQNAYPVEVYDVLGNKIYQAVLSNTQNTINLSSQPAGIYFIYVLTNDGVVNGKVMVAK